jgi:CBS domain-containing protein
MTRETIESPIHTSLTFDGSGEARTLRRVFCKRSNETVPLAKCMECPWAESWPAAGSLEAVRCHASIAPAPPNADTREKAIRTPVGDLIERNLVCVRGDADMEMLGRLLAEDGLDAVPVVDAKGHPRGIVCKTDLLQALRDRDDLTAENLMTPFVHALHEGAPLSFALAMLAAEDIEQVPIVSKDGIVVGLFAARDAVRWVAKELGYSIPEKR